MLTTDRLQLPDASRAAGASLFLQGWLPESRPKAVILVSHGYAEHGGRYAYLAERCVAAGYAVQAIDHWGHGRSDGERGYVPHFSVFLDGMACLLDLVEATYPTVPRILLGHSMGGLIAAHHLLEHQARYATTVLSGPAVQPGAPTPVMTRLIARLLSFSLPKAGLLQIEADAVSRDPAVVADYLTDPLVYKGKMSARMAAELLGAIPTLARQAPTITGPLMILHGSEDRLASPQGARQFFDQVGSADKRFEDLPGLYHEIFHEPERDQVIDLVLDRIRQTVPTAP